MLTHAFEIWQVLRVCLHTDVRNERSRAAIERIGGKFEGILRAHRMAADYTARDSARYSIVAAEWPAVKQRLIQCRRIEFGRRGEASAKGFMSIITQPWLRCPPTPQTPRLPRPCRSKRARFFPMTSGRANASGDNIGSDASLHWADTRST